MSRAEADKFYTVGTLAALILCKEIQYIHYLKKLNKDFSNHRGIELVTSNDYKDLLDFLSGITTGSARVSSINFEKETEYIGTLVLLATSRKKYNFLLFWLTSTLVHVICFFKAHLLL